jgi:integrase
LTPDEVSRLIDSARNLFHYTMLLTMYSAGLRRSADKPITAKVIWEAVQHAARKAGIEKHVTPHTLRHASAYYTTFPSLFILKAMALGQAQSTAVYGRYVRLALAPAQLAS